MKGKMKQNWWKSTVVYQIYPRSFQDSNGDGIGDLPGIVSRLDYLKELGIGAVWLSPVCRSPQADNGYDISDYQDIDPLFGKLEDMDLLIKEAEKRGIQIILDLVLNHSSNRHPWFLEAKKSRENPYHDYYIWRDGEEGCPPNDMRGVFGGSAWEWVPEIRQYYFHQFTVEQPDLNWENPKVREEIYEMINWWIDRGIGGFRLDVLDQIAKEPDKKITRNGPLLHTYIKELSRRTFQRGELITVGEAWGATIENAPVYSNPDGSEVSMVFQLEHINLDQKPGGEKWDLASLDLVKLKEVLEKWQKGLYQKGWNSLFWDNHDLPRIVSRWGNDKEYRAESAKMLATVLHGMQGTPYIYQGEELGMTNIKLSMDQYQDVETLNMYKERMAQGYSRESIMESLYAKSRDNARTPMQWDDSQHAGFTEGTPWLPVNPNYTEINAASQTGDPNSVFSYYKTLVGLRKEYEILAEGEFELICREDPDIFAYVRTLGNQKLLVAANFHGTEVPFSIPLEFDKKEGKRKIRTLIRNYPDTEPGMLRPYETFMIFAEQGE